jgi:hypothetical protein
MPRNEASPSLLQNFLVVEERWDEGKPAFSQIYAGPTDAPSMANTQITTSAGSADIEPIRHDV